MLDPRSGVLAQLTAITGGSSQVRVGDMTSIKISGDSKYALINYAPNVSLGTFRAHRSPD